MSTKLSQKLERINASMVRIREKTNLPDAVIEDVATAVETLATPTGSITITENGSVDVTDYAEAIVDVAGGSGGEVVKTNVYRVATIEERDAITDMAEGDMCVVHDNFVYKQYDGGDIGATLAFPEIIELTTAVSSSQSLVFRYNTSTLTQLTLTISSSKATYSARQGLSTKTIMSYTSSNGITYIKDTRYKTTKDYTFTRDLIHSSGAFVANLYPFINTLLPSIFGLYSYINNAWEYTNIGISLAADKLYKDEVAYTDEGTITGTLGTNPSTTYDDTNALLYSELATVYDSCDIVVAPEDSTQLYKGSDIYCIPANFQGLSLLDTSNVKTAVEMFYNCDKLTYISKLDTHNLINGEKMFWMCDNLKYLPPLDLSNLTNGYYMFNFCSELEEIPFLDTSKVENMEGMFGYCKKIKTIPLLNTSASTTFAHFLNTCESLETVPLIDTSNAVDTKLMFANCPKIRTVPLLNISKSKSTFSMFLDCTGLIEIPQFNTSSVTEMDTMVKGCTNLVTIPLLNTSNVTTMSRIVAECPNLSDNSLNNILAMAKNSKCTTKTTTYLGLDATQKEKIKSLSNYSAFISAGWTNN